MMLLWGEYNHLLHKQQEHKNVIVCVSKFSTLIEPFLWSFSLWLWLSNSVNRGIWTVGWLKQQKKFCSSLMTVKGWWLKNKFKGEKLVELSMCAFLLLMKVSLVIRWMVLIFINYCNVIRDDACLFAQEVNEKFGWIFFFKIEFEFCNKKS